VSTDKKSLSTMTLAERAGKRRKSAQLGPDRRGAGLSRLRRRMLATLDFETMTPNS